MQKIPIETQTLYAEVMEQLIRVDVMTPATKKTESGPVMIPRFKAAAQPLWFLDFLLEQTVKGAVVNGGGILVNVPDPARFAFHKLIIACERIVIILYDFPIG